MGEMGFSAGRDAYDDFLKTLPAVKDEAEVQAFLHNLLDIRCVGVDCDGNDSGPKMAPEAFAHLAAVLGKHMPQSAWQFLSYRGPKVHEMHVRNRQAMGAYLRSIGEFLLHLDDDSEIISERP